jgi:beta-RFAP synthase
MNGDLGRLYGSIGVAIERPELVLEAGWVERVNPKGLPDPSGLVVEGLEQERVAAFARRFFGHYPLPGGVRLCLQAAIPSHVGLGSGTQLALAVGTALAQLGGLALDAREVAQVVGRGVHSGIGIAAFARGGFIVDGGHRIGGDGLTAPPVLFQHPLPPNWYFVVAIPAVEPGFNGSREQQAFQTLPPAPAVLVEKICRRLLMQMLPALLEEDIASFGQALTEIQQLVGDCFAAVQGGRYANPVSGQLIGHFLDQGAPGAGQSSWGPAVYALEEGERPALLLAEEARAFLEHHGGGQVFHTSAANRGALTGERS